MRKRFITGIASVLALVAAACSPEEGMYVPGETGVQRDTGTGGDAGDAFVPNDVTTGPCVDSDGDGIADRFETSNDDDGDGTPNAMDDDTDGDGYTDANEAIANYPPLRMSDRGMLMCGSAPADSDMDGIPNFRDRDSDNDGLADSEEQMAGSDPTAEDSDMDGVSDLIERVAMSNPTDMTSMPPAGSLYVTLPYHPPGGSMGEIVSRRFPFATRIRAADIFFVVDTTGSMGATIAEVQRTLATTIIPGIRDALGPMGNARYGVAGHGDFQNGGTNYCGALCVLQRLTPDAMAAQTATMGLRAEGGGDGPESQVPAMHSLIAGDGYPGYAGGAAPGQATRMMDPTRDCGWSPDQPMPFGWGCFQPGRVPIMVLFSDAPWHNGPGMSNFYTSTPGAGTYMGLEAAMMARGGLFVGIDVRGMMDTFRSSLVLARATGTLDGRGSPVVFAGAPTSVATNVIDAITTIAGQSRQDVSTRVDPDTTEMRLAMGRTTANFIRNVVPFDATPGMPDGFERKDETTFFNVSPSATVRFDANFYNDFAPGSSTAQLFRTTIVVLGRAGSELDRREVFIIVPADTGPPPG